MATTDPQPRQRAVALLSGGLDSTTLLYHLGHLGYDVHAISVDYGQRHGNRELQAASDVFVEFRNAFPGDHVHNIISLGPMAASLLEGSALTSPDVPVPHGYYTDATMKVTVVPNRNAILLALAYGAAVSRHASIVATAVHAGDHAIYPDCRPEFITAFATMETLATEGYADPPIGLFVPFIHDPKEEIVRRGAALNVPFKTTWSCYEGHEHHCGACGTCVERREAFQKAGITDPTLYTNTFEVLTA